MEKERSIVAAIEDQFSRTFQMLQEEIKNISAKEWTRGDIDYLIPARHLCHFIVCADYYTGDTPADDYQWDKLFVGDWEEMTVEELPSKTVALQKLSEFEESMMSRFAKLNDKDLNSKETQSPWTGKTLAGKLMYLLRHSQHHLGELHAELRHRGIKRAGWR